LQIISDGLSFLDRSIDTVGTVSVMKPANSAQLYFLDLSSGGSAPSPFAFNFGTNAAGASGSFGSTPAFGSGISSFPSLSSVFKTNGAPVQLFGVGGSSAASNEAGERISLVLLLEGA
jgi:hypothetical protein